MDPSGWRVPVLVSNFGQETVMVEPFSEIGMVAQVSAIQPVMDQPSRPSCGPLMFLDHLSGTIGRSCYHSSCMHIARLFTNRPGTLCSA